MIQVHWRVRRGLIALVAIAILCFVVSKGCEYFPESTFELARDSRLPKWFSVPPGLLRDDVSVTLNYYSLPWGGRVTLLLHDKNNHTLAKVDGKTRGLEPLHSDRLPHSAEGYPIFEVVMVHGVTEIIEHKKMEPIFYVNEDAAIWKGFMGDRQR
jgi:hypothetical protein